MINVLASVVLLVGLSTASAASSSSQVPAIFTHTGKQVGVPATLLYAISKTESTYPGTGKIWPWTLNVKGKGYYFSSREQAYKAINYFMKRGIASIDIGPMQTNWYWQKSRLGNTWAALDPKFNVLVGAQILKDCHNKKKDWWVCTGDYHTLSNTPVRAARAKAYRDRVYLNLPKGTH